MRAKLRDLMDQRAAAWSKVQDIQARREQAGYNSTEEDGETYTRALDDVDKLSNEIEVEQRADRIEAVMNKPAGDLRGIAPKDGNSATEVDGEAKANYRKAYDIFLRHGAAELEPEQRKLLTANLVTDPEMRALGAATGAAGGYTVPDVFWARIVETLKAFGGIAGLATIINTDSGIQMEWPTSDGTAEVGAILGDNTQDTQLDPTFGTGTLHAFTYTSKIILVAIQLLQDTGVDIEAFLARRIGMRIGRAQAAHFAKGAGTTQPQGLTVGLTNTHTTAGSLTISYDDLVELEHTVDPAYRGRASYVLNDAAIKNIRKLKDGQQRPLWIPQMAEGVPSTINGRPYVVDNSMPDMSTADNRPVVFGDIESAYIVRMVNGAQTMRLTERYADSLQVGFLGFQRADGLVQDAAAAAALVLKA